MLLHGWASGEIEVRARGGDGSRTVRASFPYNSRATIHAGGRGKRPRKEVFKPGAFKYSLDVSENDLHFLLGHSFDAPLASRSAGSLIFKDTPQALTFEARLVPEILDVPHVQTFLALLAGNLITGISPGFRVPDIKGAETVVEESEEEGDALIRELHEVVLFEVSAVSRPAYGETEISARNWHVMTQPMQPTARPAAYRWRL